MKDRKCRIEGSRLTGGGGLSGIDVADNDDVDMSLLLTVLGMMVSNLISSMNATLLSMCPKLMKIGEDGKEKFGTYPMLTVC